MRTFQYSPWNYKRQCYDADRYGIEKGSVLIVQTSAKTPEKDAVGAFLNEGFGKVIFNPDFLDATPDTNGQAKVKLLSADKGDKNYGERKSTVLTKFLENEQKLEKADSDIYQKVNKFVKEYEVLFKDREFASQWGEIRSIAAGCKSKADLANKLYNTADSYLKHGVAAQKWDERGRLAKLQDFVKECGDDTAAPRAVIQLAAEMAKKCRR